MRKVWISAAMLVMLAGCGMSPQISEEQARHQMESVCPITDHSMSTAQYVACLHSPAHAQANALWASASAAEHSGGPIASVYWTDGRGNSHEFHEY